MAGILTPGSTGTGPPVPAGPVAASATPTRPLLANPQMGRNPQTGAIQPPPGATPPGAPPGAPPGGAPPPGAPPARLGDMFSAAPGAPGAQNPQAAMHANPTVDDALRAAWNPAIPDQQPGMLGPAMAQQQALMPRMNFVQPRIPQAIKRST